MKLRIAEKMPHNPILSEQAHIQVDFTHIDLNDLSSPYFMFQEI